jgi:Elongation factor Tu GTP binding domain
MPSIQMVMFLFLSYPSKSEGTSVWLHPFLLVNDLFAPIAKMHMNLVFIGHVDAGKSTLGGQLLYLTNMVDKRTLEKYEREAKEAGRESWYLSWALDSTTQERSKVDTPLHLLVLSGALMSYISHSRESL